MTLLVDNYDSFTYNLVQLIGVLDPDIRVLRNDEASPEAVRAMQPSRIILSPGPGKPSDAGFCEELVKQFYRTVPVLGVCLGHQAICEAFGGRIVHAKVLMHGKQSVVMPEPGNPLFCGLPETFPAARYHSLAVDRDTLPDCLKVTAETADGEVMAVCHTEYPVFGLQFHPESILTPDGAVILKNFLNMSAD